MTACIFPVATYECESRTISQSLDKKIGVFKLKCYRQVLRTQWIREVTNVDIMWDLNSGDTWLMDNIMTWNRSQMKTGYRSAEDK